MHNKHGHENRYIVKALGHERICGRNERSKFRIASGMSGSNEVALAILRERGANSRQGTKALRRFSSLAAWKHFQKSRSLEVWKSGGLKRRLSWDFTCADFINPLSCQASRLPNFGKSLAAFTMAEILISLTIIGIIAAITLPALRANINESAWTTQRKALYSRMSQAISMLPSLNGYGIGANDTETASKAAQAFISEGLSKVLKINNICDGSSVAAIEKCGFPKKFTKMGTNSKMDTPIQLTGLNWAFNVPNDPNVIYSQINTVSAAFETANGESILTFYNPNCSYTYGLNGKNNQQNLMQPTMCANFIYDLNGKKGPNKVGKDIGFMTAFYPTDSQVVAPYPAGQLQATNDGNHPQFSIGYGNLSCRKKYGDDARMANIEELKSIFTNNKLGYMNSSYTNFLINDGYRSSSLYNSNNIYGIAPYSGGIFTDVIRYNSNNFVNIFCVKH